MTAEAFASFLALPERDRRDVFTAASRRLATAPDYVEKDFWVCLVLDLRFNALPEGHPGLLFKGGTSLSKAFGLTSHQIRRQADRLLPPELADVDGIPERRGGTVSAFKGPEPGIRVLASPNEEAAAVADWLAELRQQNSAPHEIAVFVRSEGDIAKARQAVRLADLSSIELDKRPDGTSGKVAVATMHLAKGLEFRAVAVMACHDEILPLQSRIENVADEADLEYTYPAGGPWYVARQTQWHPKAKSSVISRCCRIARRHSPAATIRSASYQALSRKGRPTDRRPGCSWLRRPSRRSTGVPRIAVIGTRLGQPPLSGLTPSPRRCGLQSGLRPT